MTDWGFLAGAILLLLLGHYLRILRWGKLIKPYEKPPVSTLFRSLSLGYALNLVLPVRAGDVVRTAYVGRRLRNGPGFALATVILDRFLDIVAVAVIFVVFMATGLTGDAVEGSIVLYEMAVVTIGAGLIISRLFSTQIKKAAAGICSVFNDNIRLEGMKFFWSLINTFRDLSRIDIAGVFAVTVAMWAAYLASYGLFALSFTGSVGFTKVFINLFSSSSLGLNTLDSMRALEGSAVSAGMVGSLAYMVAPVVILYAVTLLPDSFRRLLGKTAALNDAREDADHLSVLPQIDPRDQMRFLDDYFSSSKREFIRKFIELNRDISILRDYSAGSNATTMLCMDRERTFYRKYTFGEDGEKLKAQLAWLEGHKDIIPVCRVIHKDCGEGFCCYDMNYDSGAYNMFRYMHAQPLDQSWAILRAVLDDLRENLYTRNRRVPAREDLERYLEEKVDKNLERIKGSRLLADIEKQRHIIINGRKYKNLSRLDRLFDHEYLKEIFSHDRYSDIHGDLTVENIICLDGEPDLSKAYYLIDPNTGNIHESPFLDFGKLMQSLHGGYEFLMMTKTVRVEGNRVDFLYTRSAVYDGMLEKVRGYLQGHFTPEEVRSIFHHELVHWLRLMPYKLEKDRKRAVMFYAGLIMVANDLDGWYGGAVPYRDGRK